MPKLLRVDFNRADESSPYSDLVSRVVEVAREDLRQLGEEVPRVPTTPQDFVALLVAAGFPMDRVMMLLGNEGTRIVGRRLLFLLLGHHMAD